jgi:hypothetical protein
MNNHDLELGQRCRADHAAPESGGHRHPHENGRREQFWRPFSCVKNLRLVSGPTTHGHEHKCTWVETGKINSTRGTDRALGWELVTAYCGPSSSSTVTHYLYFRREVGGR